MLKESEGVSVLLKFKPVSLPLSVLNKVCTGGLVSGPLHEVNIIINAAISKLIFFNNTF